MMNKFLFMSIPLLLVACASQEEVAAPVCPRVTVEHLGQIPEPAPRIVYKYKYVYVKDHAPQPTPEPTPPTKWQKWHDWWEKHHWHEH